MKMFARSTVAGLLACSLGDANQYRKPCGSANFPDTTFNAMGGTTWTNDFSSSNVAGSGQTVTFSSLPTSNVAGVFVQTNPGYPSQSTFTEHSAGCGTAGSTCSSMTNPDVVCSSGAFTDGGLSITVNGLTTTNCNSVEVVLGYSSGYTAGNLVGNTLDLCGVCVDYCEAQAANCQGDNAISFDGTCWEDCMSWTTGTDGDQSGDTAYCRLYHANAAAGDAATHCPHASPDGGGVCGSYCENLCRLDSEHCTGDNANTYDTDCATTCATYAAGTAGDTSGDSVQCRLYHAHAAASDPATHCPHVSDDGGGVCGSYCENLCRLDGQYCTGDNQNTYDTDCATTCATYAAGTAGDTSGDSVQCRLYHAHAASGAPATHCPHVSDDGGGVCGTYCENLCRLDGQYCTGANANTYDTDCATTCASYPAGTAGDTSGDSVQCRLYHAHAASGAPATHCPHVSDDGGGVCGSYCDNLCRLDGEYCTGANANTYDTDCATTCGTYPAGTAGDTSGDSVQCRLYHAHAASGAPATHCPHVSDDGGGVCGSFCDNLCRLDGEYCTGDNQNTYGTDCATSCASYPAGVDGDTAINSVQCRLYHAHAASSAPATHCTHAGENGGGVCVGTTTTATVLEAGSGVVVAAAAVAVASVAAAVSLLR